MLASWLHLLALTAYVGAIAGLLLIVLPGVAALETHESRVTLLVRSLKFYNPLQCGALGLLVITGAIQVTDLKAVYRETFTHEFGAMLGMKLVVAFVLILLSVQQTMSVGLRFVRRAEGGAAITPEELQSITRRLKSSTLSLLVLSTVTVWLGMRLGR